MWSNNDKIFYKLKLHTKKQQQCVRAFISIILLIFLNCLSGHRAISVKFSTQTRTYKFSKDSKVQRKKQRMWFEILPSALIVAFSLYITGPILYGTHKLFLGNVSVWENLLYLISTVYAICDFISTGLSSRYGAKMGP